MMGKKHISKFCTLFIVVLLTMGFFSPEAYSANCSDCHPAMLEEPFYLTFEPVVDVMSVFYSPCGDYNKVLEEWYYTESFFTTMESHFDYLHAKRVELEDFRHNLQKVRDLYRDFTVQPVTSLADFKRRAGGLRYEMGKTYSEVRHASLGISDRNVFGIIILFTLFLLIMFITGWKIAAGPAEVHPRDEEAIKRIKVEEEAEK